MGLSWDSRGTLVTVVGLWGPVNVRWVICFRQAYAFFKTKSMGVHHKENQEYWWYEGQAEAGCATFMAAP